MSKKSCVLIQWIKIHKSVLTKWPEGVSPMTLTVQTNGVTSCQCFILKVQHLKLELGMSGLKSENSDRQRCSFSSLTAPSVDHDAIQPKDRLHYELGASQDILMDTHTWKHHNVRLFKCQYNFDFWKRHFWACCLETVQRNSGKHRKGKIRHLMWKYNLPPTLDSLILVLYGWIHRLELLVNWMDLCCIIA